MRLISGPERDASPSVRQAAGYALWSMTENEQLSRLLCGGGAGSAVVVPALAAALEDAPRVAEHAAAALMGLLLEKGVFDDEMRRAAWARVPALIARIDAGSGGGARGARPGDVAAMCSAFDLLIKVCALGGRERRVRRGGGGRRPTLPSAPSACLQASIAVCNLDGDDLVRLALVRRGR